MVDEVSWAVTPVKDQARTGTCWAYGGVSMLESEVMRRGGEELNLSEMWVARNAWKEKAVKYVRLNGRMNLWQGGELHDVLYIVDRYGIVPQSVYEGNSSDGEYDHRELCNAMVACAEKMV
ncbi:MAG: aminopeptidase, partial [Rikenellaceae bacterium]|nr:aminopeptidase [Rikenellaceae bacterium]